MGTFHGVSVVEKNDGGFLLGMSMVLSNWVITPM